MVFQKKLLVNVLSFSGACFLSILLLFQCRWYIALIHTVIHEIMMSTTELIVGSLASCWMLRILGRPFDLRYYIAYGVTSKLLYLVTVESLVLLIRTRRHDRSDPIWPESSVIILNTMVNVSLLFFLLMIGNSLDLPPVLGTTFGILSALLLAANLLLFQMFDRLQHSDPRYPQAPERLVPSDGRRMLRQG